MSKLGTVYLVGAGPGDPGLISLRAVECLQRADLVLYDGLVNPLVLRHTKAQAERTCRSPGPDGRVLKQDEINRRLIEAARAGKTVVRLKGGDPFIFGRGGEEAAALAEAGIPFEVVPGITAATAAGEYAGISLTHRELASAVAFVTGHEDPNKNLFQNWEGEAPAEPQPNVEDSLRESHRDSRSESPTFKATSIDYDNLARFSGTLVFYMGLHRLAWIVESLLKAGKDPGTPACVISRATTAEQRTVSAPLWELPAEVAKHDLHAPSLIVVGECVRQRETIAWFERRPLFGRRIGITRPDAQAGPQIARVLELGAQPVLLPTIEILPPEDWTVVDATLARLAEYDWLVFTSANGVLSLLERLWETGGDLRRLADLKLAAIGPATAEALARFHLRTDVVPDSYRAEALAEVLAPHVRDQRVLWAGASRGRDVLPVELEAAGASVEKLVVYRNVDIERLPPAQLEMIERGELDWIGLSSPSIARSLRQLLTPAALESIAPSQPDDPAAVQLASISPVTTAAATESGLPIAAEARDYTWEGIFEAIIAAEARS